MTYRLFEHDSASFEKEVAHECVTEDFTKITRPKSKVGTLFVKRAVYKQSLLTADFLLPDGIALQVWSQLTAKKKLHNLNGTDLTPALLSYLNQHHKASVYIYSLYDPKIGKGEEWLHKAIANIRHTYPKVHIAFSHQSVYSNR